MQVVYPIFKNGVAQTDIPPRVQHLTNTGDVTKPPIFIHYNGYNHYNAIVPASFDHSPKVFTRNTSKSRSPATRQPVANTFTGLAAL